ncbi:Leucine-rich repeat-containing protein 28 [Holothuria leucospilota]|uniref:Leucine-rich repeat-containing protein 28 n=1 Tax=Holothuria leucospilota TaxID=206669 RepID=A0A9Q1BMN3_HOLLE|nr:Leucine-rich repeat-containing protein 28 [Holothuria leucospilota]
MEGSTRPKSFITEDHEVSGIEEILRDALKDGHTILHLNYKGLEKLPPALLDKCFEQVEKLFLKRNRLTTLPTTIGILKSLKDLYLPSNEISSLPEEICELKQLECLDVSQNCLLSLPSSIGKLPSLEKLYVSSNALTEIPREIGDLQNLKVLIVTNNQLETLPKEICLCSKLHTLHVDKNHLQRIPQELIKLTSLKELSLMGNLLTHIPMLLGANSNLTSVNISNNPYLLTVVGNSYPFGAVHSVYSNISGCGFRDPLDLGLNPKQVFHIHNCRTVLPPELTNVWPAADKIHQPFPLQELTLRTCYKYRDILNIDQLPTPIQHVLDCPIAVCAMTDCDIPIYTCAYAIAEKIQGPVNKVTLYHSNKCMPLLILRLVEFALSAGNLPPQVY